MPGSAILNRFLGAFRRKTPPPPFAAELGERLSHPVSHPVSCPAPRADEPEPAPVHPIATSNGANGFAAIVVPSASHAADAAWDADGDALSPPSPAVVAFVDEIRQLPLFSTTAMQLMRTVDDDDASPDRIARLISADAGLVAQLLRIVNSPYYGLQRRCSTIGTAIAVLGLNRVRRTVLAAVTQRPLMAYLHDTHLVQTFWRHQLLCAALSRHLAVQQGLDSEMAYTAGLMHEVGRLAILIRHPHLTNVLLAVDDGGDRLALRHERSHFRFDHAEVGGALLARWGLPPAIVRATTEHERVSQPGNPFSAVVWRANLLAHEMAAEGDVDDTDEAVTASPWMEAFGLSVAERRRILDEIAALELGPE